MAHNEAEIRRAIKPLLSVYGELNTSEVKELLDTVLIFDDEDKKPSKTREGEILITQRIGNIVAHQADKVKTYDEGFIVDKNFRPAKFSLLNPTSNTEISSSEIKTIKARRKGFVARKIDWEKSRDRNNEIGDQGEEFVMEYEMDRLVTDLLIDRIIAMRSVQHLSRMQGDGLGFDILSINNEGNPRYIEVKTTSGNFNHPFYMSRNERSFFEEYGNDAFIYRVYNFNKETRHGEVRIISQSELFADFNFDAITWQVTPKKP